MTPGYEFFWRALEGALGSEKVAYLRNAPLDVVVLRKIAAEYSDQRPPERLTLEDVVRHIGEKHAFAKKQWRMVEDGIESVRQLRVSGHYKRASLLPRGTLQKKLAVRDRLLLIAQVDSSRTEKVAQILPEYDKQLAEYLGPERTKMAGSAGLWKDVMKATKPFRKSTFGKGMIGGAGAATALAVPAAVGGTYAMNKAEDKAKGMIPAMALAGAGGALLGGVGMGLGSHFLNNNKAPQRMR